MLPGHVVGSEWGSCVPITVREEGPEALAAYSTIPIAYEVASRFVIEAIDVGLGGFTMHEEPVVKPYTKDYDTPEQESPMHWARRFDLTNWGLLFAYEGDAHVGGAALAFDTPGVGMLEGRRDLAVLWDIRVHPSRRHTGIGVALFERAREWARARGCRQLKVETQDVNVPACRFYAKQGCELGAIHRYAYAGDATVAHEAMLLWYLDL
jgi:GNAT superfamily N-acetyltransferase